MVTASVKWLLKEVYPGDLGKRAARIHSSSEQDIHRQLDSKELVVDEKVCMRRHGLGHKRVRDSGETSGVEVRE